LETSEGSRSSISLQGAHVLSWIPAGGSEQLFLSPKAEFGPGTAIRGGVPVIFPQFSTLGSLPRHGFARNLEWELARREQARAVFWLSESALTRGMWPHRFLAEYIVLLTDEALELRLTITNTDVSPFQFTAALHSYLRVADARQAYVKDLSGLSYMESNDTGRNLVMESERLTFASEVDRIYLDTPPELQLVDGERTLVIRTEGFRDAVIWNPGPLKCAAMADMEADGYLKFVCVESAAVGRPVILAPGDHWRGVQKLKL